MKHIFRLAALALLMSAAAPATAQDLAAPTEPGFKVTRVQLGISGPPGHICPGVATMNVWVFTNQPGTASFLIVRKSGDVAGPYQVEAVAGAGGVNLGTYARQLNIVQPIDAEYRVVIPNSDVASLWVPLYADC